MTAITLEEARRRAQELLREWKTDSAEHRWLLVERAEAIEDELHKAGVLDTDTPGSGLAALVDAVYSVLAAAHHQHFLPEDVPIAQEVLAASPGNEGEALRRFNEYWDDVDSDERASRSSDFWFKDGAA